MTSDQIKPLVDGILDGDPASLARSISLVENRETGFRELLKHVYAHSGSAKIIGVTGPPGSGKSTIVDALASRLADDGKVGVIAVDPSSPYTGGSILGDRIRFGDQSNTSDVFFRSMSARGSEGGLAEATSDAIQLLDGAGYGTIIVETVGAGQNEIDIVSTADTVVVVMMPSTGDEIQMMKAGILEIADIFVVNKMDLTGADRTVTDLNKMIRMAEEEGTIEDDHKWDTPVIKMEARKLRNLDELLNALREHQIYLRKNLGERKQIERHKKAIRHALRNELNTLVENLIENEGGLEMLAEKMSEDNLDPYSMADEIISKL